MLRLYDATESARSFEHGETNVLVVVDEGDPALVGATLGIVDAECGGADGLDEGLVDRWLAHRNDVSALAPLWRGGIVVDTSSHQSHAYTDGACLYFTFAGRPPDAGADGGSRSEAEGRDWTARYYRRAWDEVTRATLDAGGAISHHHGIGLNRARFLPEALGPGFGVLSAVKRALDPRGILNPGKLGLDSPFGEVPWP